MASDQETHKVQISDPEIQVVPDIFSERTRIVEKFLEPHDVTDQAGFKRRIYKQKNTRFSFRGREELPVMETVKNSQTVLLGSRPVHIDANDYQEYESQFAPNENKNELDNLESCYLATKDLSGVLALAAKLGAEDPDLINMLQEIKSGIYSEKSLALIDRLIAANNVKDDGSGWDDSFAGGDAEAVVVLSLMGNKEANNYLNSKLKQMNKLDKLRESQEDKVEIDKHIDQQVCVHATSFKPNKFGENGYEIKTTGDATNFEYVRNTIHVALNHKVVSHWMGNWDQSSYTILSPMKDVVEMNGSPKSDQEWDIWWTRNPGETLKFPNAIIVESGKTPPETLYVKEDKLKTFKDGEYTIDDLLNTEQFASCNIRTFNDFKSIFFISKFENKQLKESLDLNWNIEKLAQLFVEKYFPDEKYPGERKNKEYSYIIQYCISRYGDLDNFEQNFRTAANLSVAERVKQIFEDINISTAYIGSADNFEKAAIELSVSVSKKIESEIFSELSSTVVKNTIKEMGYEYTGGGNWPSAHNGSPYDWITRSHSAAIDIAKEVIGTDDDGNEIKGKFDWTKFKPIWQKLPDVDPKTRRVAYASGAFNSRV